MVYESGTRLPFDPEGSSSLWTGGDSKVTPAIKGSTLIVWETDARTDQALYLWGMLPAYECAVWAETDGRIYGNGTFCSVGKR